MRAASQGWWPLPRSRRRHEQRSSQSVWQLSVNTVRARIPDENDKPETSFEVVLLPLRQGGLGWRKANIEAYARRFQAQILKARRQSERLRGSIGLHGRISCRGRGS